MGGEGEREREMTHKDTWQCQKKGWMFEVGEEEANFINFN